MPGGHRRHAGRLLRRLVLGPVLRETGYMTEARCLDADELTDGIKPFLFNGQFAAGQFKLLHARIQQ